VSGTHKAGGEAHGRLEEFVRKALPGDGFRGRRGPMATKYKSQTYVGGFAMVRGLV
jgi:hypothetical protein